MLKLLSTAALAAVAFADEPVGTVIGIDLGTTYSVSGACPVPRKRELFVPGCREQAALLAVFVASAARALGTAS